MKIKIIATVTVMIVCLVSLMGCTTPGTDFDTVKVVATITRNGGDYELTPSGESGYDLHVVSGTLSIEALGLDFDSQSIETKYDTSVYNNKKFLQNMYGGGITGMIKGWWSRMKQGIHFNTVDDLSIADYGTLGNLELPTIEELGMINYLGDSQQSFNLNSTNTYLIPSFGAGIYSATIPRSLFPNNNPVPGYIVMNDPDDKYDYGVKVSPSGTSTGFVMYDGYDYRIIVITNSIAKASDRETKVWASVSLFKPDLVSGTKTTFRTSSEFLGAWSEYMERDLKSSSTNALTNIDTVITNSVSTAMENVPGYGITKTFKDIKNALASTYVVSEYERKNFEEDIGILAEDSGKVFKNAYNSIKASLDGVYVKKSWSFTGDRIDFSNGLSKTEKDLIVWSYTSTEGDEKGLRYRTIQAMMDLDLKNYMQKQLDSLYSSFCSGKFGDVVSWSGNLLSFQIVDNSQLAILDASTREAIKTLSDIDFFESVPTLNMSDLEEFAKDLKADITAEVTALIPDYVVDNMRDVEQQVTNLSSEIEKLNAIVFKFEQRLEEIRSYVHSMIPDTISPSIFPYQTPPAVFTKIIDDFGDFLQADPTSSFSSSCSVSVPDGWSLSTGYPRAVIITQSDGTRIVTLQQDSTTGSYLLRTDMIGSENLTVGDTVKTYFEVKVTNGTANASKVSSVYYTRIEKSWLSEELDRLGIVIDGILDTQEEIQTAVNWLNFDDDIFEGGNQSSLEPFYATLTVKDEDGSELYVKNSRKSFKLDSYDSETLVWEVIIYENEPYSLYISVGNNTEDAVVTYSDTLNTGKTSWWNPMDWGTKIRSYF